MPTEDAEPGDTISPSLLDRRPAEVYRLKIGELGERRQSDGRTWRIPRKLDHFRVTRREREGGDRLGNFVKAEEIHEEVGEEPTELRVRLMYDTPGDNFFSQMQEYDGRELAVRCDGETREDVRTGETGPCRRGENGEGCDCKPYGRLPVVLEAAPTFGSVAVFRTTSWESVRNIQSSLELVYEQLQMIAELADVPEEQVSLAGLPFLLRLYPATDRFEQGGETRTSTSWKVSLELAVPFMELQEVFDRLVRKRLSAASSLRALGRSVRGELEELDAREEPDIADEFHPDPDRVASAETADRIAGMKEEAGIEDEGRITDTGDGGEPPEDATEERPPQDAERGPEDPEHGPERATAQRELLSALADRGTDADDPVELAGALAGYLAEKRDEVPADVRAWGPEQFRAARTELEERGQDLLVDVRKWSFEQDQDEAETGEDPAQEELGVEL